MKSIIKSSKCTVTFIFRDSLKSLQKEPNKESLLMLKFSYSGNRMKYSTGYKCCLANWNVEKQRVKTNKSGVLISDEVNEHLNNLESSLRKEFARLVAEGIPVTKKALKNHLDQITNKNVEEIKKPLDFWEVSGIYLSMKGKQVSPATFKQHKQSFSHLRHYEEHYDEKLKLDSITMEFYYKYIELMENEGYALNTIGKQIKNLIAFMNFALYEGYSSNDRFKGSDFKVLRETTTAVSLDEEEILKLKEVDLSYDKRLERARDLFLIGCDTGQRVSDFNQLKSDQIVKLKEQQFFRVKQKKTGKVVHCPITKGMKEIFIKYDGHPPETMPDQKINEYLKRICRKVGMNELVQLYHTRGGKPIEEKKPKYCLVSTHTARRSFCTNKYRKKMPVFDIMLFSGHASEKEFYNYIRIKDEDRAAHIANSDFFDL